MGSDGARKIPVVDDIPENARLLEAVLVQRVRGEGLVVMNDAGEPLMVVKRLGNEVVSTRLYRSTGSILSS